MPSVKYGLSNEFPSELSKFEGIVLWSEFSLQSRSSEIVNLIAK